MPKSLLHKFVYNFEKSLIKNEKHLVKNIELLIFNLVKSLKNKESRIIIIAVGGNANLLKAMSWDLSYNLAIEKEKFIVINPGEIWKKEIENWESFSGIRSESVFELNLLKLTKDDVVIGISSSGTNQFIWGAIEYAKSCGCFTSLITNNKSAINKVKANNYILFEIDKYIINNLRSFEGSTSLKVVIDSIMLEAAIKSGRTYKDELIYAKWNNEFSKNLCVEMICRLTKLNKEESKILFTKAGESTAIAVVMYLKNWNKNDATRAIVENNYDFNKIIS